MKRVAAVLGSLSALLCCAVLVLAPAAGAQQIVVGQTASPSSPPITCEESSSYVEFQLHRGRNSYVFPSAGLVTSWSVWGGSSGAKEFGVKILRPVLGNSFKVVGGEVGFSLAPNVLNTYPLSVQVEAGDILGAQFYGLLCQFPTGLSGDQIRWDKRIALTGSTVSFIKTTESGARHQHLGDPPAAAGDKHFRPAQRLDQGRQGRDLRRQLRRSQVGQIRQQLRQELHRRLGRADHRL